MSTATNRLNGETTNDEQHQGHDKIDRHGWSDIKDDIGEFRMIPKAQLLVDHTYQRSESRQGKVLSMAREWSWRHCCCLAVSERNGQFFVFDGQHRLAAAKKRSDIKMLPCMVHQGEELSDEADAFVGINTNRGAVRATDKHRAAIVAGDETAIKVRDAVAEVGYSVATGGADFTVSCVRSLENACKQDERNFLRTLALCADIADGKAMHNEVFKGVFYLFRSAPDEMFKNSEKLVQYGQTGLVQKIAEAKAFRGSGGEKACAEGIVSVINHRKRNKVEI